MNMTVKLPPDLIKQIEAAASDEYISKSAFVRRAVAQALASAAKAKLLTEKTDARLLPA